MNLPPNHIAIKPRKTGLLLINLGTPEATDYWSVRKYLREFLSDRRVIEINRVLWWFILNFIILAFRPTKSGRAYAKIWNVARNESPLKTFTRAQSEKVSKTLANGGKLMVDWAMRYGQPTLKDKLEALKAEGCDRIVLFPLYPQYSAATTATALDKAYEVLKTMRWQPAIRTVPPYFDHPIYVDALATSLKTCVAGLSWKPDRLLVAFHGLPQAYFDKGDPYYCHCQKTARLLREKMGYSADYLQVVFQSRFGRAKWLQPYAQETVAALPAQGVKNLLMISPGFAADCVETLEELAIGLDETFKHKGGINFAVVPCLNDSADSIAMLNRLARNELQGWL